MKITIFQLCALFILLFTACNSEQTLQEYFVDNAENPDFLSIDVPVSIFDIDKKELTAAQKNAIESLTKLNVLAFKLANDNNAAFQSEKAKVSSILKNDEFSELIKINTSYGKLTVKYLGDHNAIDEIIIYGDSADKGFLLVRVLGNNMNSEKIAQFIQVLKNSNYAGKGLEKIQSLIMK